MPTHTGNWSLREDLITANLIGILPRSNLKYFKAGAH